MIDRVNKLMHTIEKDFDVLFNLLIAHQVLEVSVRVIAIFSLIEGR